MIRKLSKAIGVIALSIYLYFAYHLLVIPGALDFSFYGILGFVVAAILAILVLPKGFRLRAALLSIGIIMIARGFDNVGTISRALQIIDICIITLVAGWLLRKFANIRWNTTILAVLPVLVLTYVMPIANLPFLTHFGLQYQTTNLVDPTTSVYPAYPVHVEQGSSASGDQIITESNRPNRAISGKQLDSKKDTMLVSLALNGSPNVNLVKANQLSDSLFADFGTVGFPYDTYTLYNVKGYVQQEFRPLTQPQDILQNVLHLASFPVMQTNMELATLHEDKLAWDVFQAENGSIQSNSNPADLQIVNQHILGEYAGKSLNIPTNDVKVLGVGHLLPGTGEQIVTEGSNRLDVYDATSGNLLATYQSNIDVPLPGSVIFGDIDGDGQEELLVNTVPARILKLTQNDQWQTLWVSPKDSFRFESVGKLGNDPNVTIIANSPSEVRDVDTRYMTGYVYTGGTLERQWRIPRGALIFPQLVKQQNATGNELLATDYGTQKMYILSERHIPVQLGLLVLYAVYLLGALMFRGVRKGGRAHV